VWVGSVVGGGGVWGGGGVGGGVEGGVWGGWGGGVHVTLYLLYFIPVCACLQADAIGEQQLKWGKLLVELS